MIRFVAPYARKATKYSGVLHGVVALHMLYTCCTHPVLSISHSLHTNVVHGTMCTKPPTNNHHHAQTHILDDMVDELERREREKKQRKAALPLRGLRLGPITIFYIPLLLTLVLLTVAVSFIIWAPDVVRGWGAVWWGLCGGWFGCVKRAEGMCF